MNLLVSLFLCLVARGCRKRGNRQTGRQTIKYSNPRSVQDFSLTVTLKQRAMFKTPLFIISLLLSPALLVTKNTETLLRIDASAAPDSNTSLQQSGDQGTGLRHYHLAFRRCSLPQGSLLQNLVIITIISIKIVNAH